MDEQLFSFEGFLQQSGEGGWILCDAPNLKSCCQQKHLVVSLEGDFSRYGEGSAVTVSGIYREGALSGVRVEEKNGSFPYWSCGAVLVLLCLLIWRRVRPLPP